MIKTSKELIIKAYQNNYSVPAINVTEIDAIYALFNACQELKSPVIIQISPLQIKNRPFSYKNLIDIINLIGKDYQVDYAIHLDHAESLNEIVKASKEGFTSMMIDGSHLSLHENIEITNKARKITGEYISLEAELGVLGVKEGNIGEKTKYLYTDIEEAKTFIKETKIDMLAVAIGNSHGVYIEKPHLNINLLKELNHKLGVPLVLHGASGLKKVDIEQAIKHGVAKINFFTDIDYAFTEAINQRKEKEITYTFSYMQNVYRDIEEKIKEKILLCKSGGRL